MKAYIRLIRPLNLLIIALTQYFVRYLIINPVLSTYGTSLQLNNLDFLLLVLSTVLLAAGGYIINDYFDVDIDMRNKPDAVLLGTEIKLKTADILHKALTGIGIGFGIYVAFRAGMIQLGFIFVIIAFALWYYSFKYKRIFLWGNLTVALLCSLSVAIVWLFEFFALRHNTLTFIDAAKGFETINLFILCYSIFAFLTSLIREIIKDIEDIEGDKEEGCNTLPVVLGIKASKGIIIALIILELMMTGFVQYYLYLRHFYYIIVAILIAIQGPLFYLVSYIPQSNKKGDYGFCSGLAKIIILLGILSMLLFYFYVLK